MATVTDVTTQPSSGLNHIDALLDSGPGWNWIAPGRNTLYYSFSLTDGNPSDIGAQYSGATTAFNATQQAAAISALNLISSITGVQFEQRADGSAADLHFAAANLVSASTSGFCSSRWSYSFSGTTVNSYTADAWIYLDNAEFAAANGAPTAGTSGFETLLHEIGHAMGLKHPFEGGVQLPGGVDNTSFTLMSYTHAGGPYQNFNSYDIAALLWLYGGDGLAGSLGQGTPGLYLMGTTAGDGLTTGNGDDVLVGLAGDDTLTGGAGSDTAVYAGNRSQYTLGTAGANVTVTGPDGADTLSGIEFLRFADQTVPAVGGGGGGGGGNSAPTGSLSIIGTAQQGTVLSIGSSLADANGLGPLSYRWQSSPDGNNWTDLAGATAISFTPTQTQVGFRLRVTGSYTDGAGNPETANSAATGIVANVNDPPTGAVTVSGTARSGQALQASPSLADIDGLGTVSVRWQQSANGVTWSDIAGATSAQFNPGPTQVGLFLRAVASYVDGQGTPETVNSVPTAAVTAANSAPTGGLSITGTAAQGQTLNATSSIADADGMGSLAVRWQMSSDGSSWTDIGGANGLSFTAGEAQVGRLLRATASYTDGQGSPETVSSLPTAAVVNVNDPLTGTVSIAGVLRQSNVLSAVSTLVDADGLGSMSWRWQSSADGTTWSDIAGATGIQYIPSQAQVGQRLRVVVNLVDGHGTAESATSAATEVVVNTNDLPTGSVVIAGTPIQGQVLSATENLADVDGLGPLTLQWQRSTNTVTWTAISGATSSTFTPGQAEVGFRIRVQASYVDGQGSAEVAASAATLPVLNVNDPPTGSVLVQGTAKVGQLLQSSAALADLDGLGSLRYEWQQSAANGTWLPIAGATTSSFTPGSAQAGLSLRLMVRYTDGLGAAESLPSAPTTAVLAASAVLTGTPNNDVLTGGATGEEIQGLAGNDRLTGGGGDDSLNGGDGLDAAVYAGDRVQFTVTKAGDGVITVASTGGSEGTDTVRQVERLIFRDQALAFDLDGPAGVTARDLGAVFGKASVANKVYAGIGIGLLDGGMSVPTLMQFALDAQLGVGYSNSALVTLLYTNLVGQAPSSDELAYWVGTVQSGEYTPVSLALMAADLELNAANIDLVGLSAQGLPYIPSA